MRKHFLPPAAFALVCLFSATASAAAHFVHHEQSANYVAAPTCPSGGIDPACGRYVENTDRAGSPGFQIYSPEAYSLHFKVEFQFFTNRATIFYTTDGTTPTANDNCSASTGILVCSPTPAGTTRSLTVDPGGACTYSDQNSGCQIVDVLGGQIPAQAAGTTVRYIIAAWHTGGGEVVYANSGGTTCVTCSKCHSGTSGCATVFEYGVIAPPATPLIISEFRLRGPGADGVVPSADDDDDEFVEIYNKGDADVIVNTYDGSDGFALAASDGVTRFTIPNGTRIPARGHFLGVNSVGYSLGAYPAATRTANEEGAGARGAQNPTNADAPGVKSRLRAMAPRGTRTTVSTAAPGGAEIPVPGAAAGDVSYAIPIADNAGIALFNTSNPANFNLATRLDAVGSTSELNTDYKEGAGYPAIIPLNINYTFFRDLCGKGGATWGGGACPTGGFPADTGDNAADFLFADPSGTDAGAGRRIGAPGPQNSTSPVQRNNRFPSELIFPCVASGSAPNRERDFRSGPANTSTFGTLYIRRRVTNNTGGTVTRLRFRVIDLSTYPSPAGWADLRVISSTAATVASPCTSLPTLVQGTTLETPPAQTNGGGFNSSLSADTVTALTSLLPGATYDFQLVLGIQKTGSFKFYVNVEALP